MKPRARFIRGSWFFRFTEEFPGKEVLFHHDLCDGWKCFMSAHGLYRECY